MAGLPKGIQNGTGSCSASTARASVRLQQDDQLLECVLQAPLEQLPAVCGIPALQGMFRVYPSGAKQDLTGGNRRDKIDR